MLSSYYGCRTLQFFNKKFTSLNVCFRRKPRFISSGFNNFENVHFFFSPAYNCEGRWNSRLKDPYIKDIKPVQFYYDLVKKYKNDGKVSSIDADIFLNSINQNYVEDMTDEMEEVLRLLRRSPETVNTFQSTTHAVVRTFLEAKKYDLLLKLILDPMNYGVFLDFYTCNLLMDTFIKERNYMAAARVASTLMLQEDFGPPLTRSLVLLSCFKYVFNTEENKPWEDFNPVVEPEEEVKIVVKYIRNPYFDDHFDLKDPLHIVGKTLAWLSYHLEDPLLKINSQLLGWSFYEKWHELKTSLEIVSKEKWKVSEELFTKMSNQLKVCQDEEMKSHISSLLTKIMNDSLVSNFNVMENVAENVIECIRKYEEESIKNQESVYDEWVEKREEGVKKQLELYERKRIMEEIKTKKEDLQKREDVIFFFDNKAKFELLLPRKRYYPKKLSLIYHKKKPKVVDAEYIPPEV